MRAVKNNLPTPSGKIKDSEALNREQTRHIGLCAAVERGPSMSARSGNT